MARLKNGNLWLQYNNQQLYETKILTEIDKQYQFVEPYGADRDILLPPASTTGGLEYTIANISTNYNLIIKDSNNIILSLIEPGNIVKFVSNNIVWKAIQHFPIAEGDNDFVVGNSYSGNWSRKTLEETKELLDIPLIASGIENNDILRWNTTTKLWESKSEPFEYKQIVLTPSVDAILNKEGSFFYKSTEKVVYVCTDDT
jgi:hypothetical protein